jgi:D-alanyl-D-alanine carboxypeptidase/D-alanyl-D-alanine carboxypeptidase (penicillin-binding protein 5/6)
MLVVFLASTSMAYAGYASIVVDSGTGEVLNEVNPDELNHPASLTKMMTLYLAFEALESGHLHWDQPLRVSTWAADKSPTKLGLVPGSTITVRDCVLGMIVLSANDAATVMAESLGGTESAFAAQMTAKARALGMPSTTFVNASGLPDEQQVTTARDLIKLSVSLFQDFPQEYPLFATRQFIFHGGMDGLKTGYTGASGFNLASSAVRDGHRLFGVVMGGASAWSRDQLMATLLDNGFAHRPTDPVLVAEAAGQSTRVARRIFASAERVMEELSPVQKAEAETITPAPKPAAASEHWVVEAKLRVPRHSRGHGHTKATRHPCHNAHHSRTCVASSGTDADPS